MLKFLVVTFTVVGLAVSGPADFIKKCVSSDSKCLKQTTAAAIPYFVKGIPEFGIEPMDPLVLKEIDASSPSLTFTLRDFIITGLKSCKAKKIQRDVSKSQLYIRLICDVQGKGHYNMKGQLLVLPIEGNGKIQLRIDKIAINADIDMAIKTKADGKRYWEVKDWRYSYDLKERAHLAFENLFENNEVLRTAAHDLIANNSNEIIKEIGGPIIKAIVAKIINNVKRLFDHQPYDDLSLD